MQSHVVFGAGLIGCFVGAVLASKGLNTALVCRKTVQQKLGKGISLSDYQQHTVELKSLNTISDEALKNTQEVLLPADFLWLTVKCTGVQQASQDIKPLVGPDTVIFCCQNGLGSEQIVQQQFPDNKVLRVMVPFNVVEIEPGHLHRGSEGTLCIESTAESGQMVESLVALLNSPIMPVTQSKDMSSLLWAKLQLNLGNSINALADCPVKKMLEQRSYRLVIAAMMKELLAVTKAQNIQLPKVTSLPAAYVPSVLSLPDLIFKMVANKMLAVDPEVRTSMWWDLSQGKHTEIDYLNGAILPIADKLGIPCPVNKRVVELIKKAEKQNSANIERQAIAAKELLKLVTDV